MWTTLLTPFLIGICFSLAVCSVCVCRLGTGRTTITTTKKLAHTQHKPSPPTLGQKECLWFFVSDLWPLLRCFFQRGEFSSTAFFLWPTTSWFCLFSCHTLLERERLKKQTGRKLKLPRELFVVSSQNHCFLGTERHAFLARRRCNL